MIALAVGKTGVLEHDPRAWIVGLDLEARHRVHAFGPRGGAPRLDDADVGHQFELPSGDPPAERRERGSRLIADLRRRTAGHGAEFGAVDQRSVHAGGRGVEVALLADRGGHEPNTTPDGSVFAASSHVARSAGVVNRPRRACRDVDRVARGQYEFAVTDARRQFALDHRPGSRTDRSPARSSSTIARR